MRCEGAGAGRWWEQSRSGVGREKEAVSGNWQCEWTRRDQPRLVLRLPEAASPHSGRNVTRVAMAPTRERCFPRG